MLNVRFSILAKMMQIDTAPKICFYLKIHIFYAIITKLGENVVLMCSSFQA